MSLHDTKIKASKAKPKTYRLTDGKGLAIEIRPSGARVWIYRYRIDGKANIYTIGEYTQPGPGHISIDAARAERVRCRALVKAGIHPKADRDQQQVVKRAESGNTFEPIAREWMERGRKGLLSGKPWSEGHADRIQSAMERYVFPTLGKLPIRTIGASHIRGIMDTTVELGIANTAIDIRTWCGATFAHACITERADTDPTYALRRYVARPKVKHKTPLTRAGIKTMCEKIETTGAFLPTRIALRLLMRLFVRPSELRCAEWSEFNLPEAVWIIPAVNADGKSRMKKGVEHRVPLSTQAVALLRELHGITGTRRHLFPNHRTKDTPMAECTMNQFLQRIGYSGKFTPHGFRATASTELHELNYDPALISFQLSHKEVNATKASYNGAQYWAKRKELMQSWSNLIDEWCRDDSNVVPIGGKIAA